MSYSGDAAEQVVKMSLEGAEVAAKITGKGAKQIALLLYAALTDEKKTKGKTRLNNLLRTGKELKVFAVKDEELLTFCKEAKRYGILYCALKDRDSGDKTTDIMVRAEDASKVARIFERYHLSSVDMASVRSEIERTRAEGSTEHEQMRPMPGRRSKEDIFLDALMSNPAEKEKQEKNPTMARAEESRLSETSSNRSKGKQEKTDDGLAPKEDHPRKSVRQELQEIRTALTAARKTRAANKESMEQIASKLIESERNVR